MTKWNVHGLEEIYLRTIEDLEAAIGVDPHKALKASADLRKIFIDKEVNLIDQLKDKYPVPLIFDVQTVVFYTVNGAAIDQYWEFNTRPPIPGVPYMGKPILRLSLPAFLSHEIMLVDGEKFTIRDMITYAANVAGGVHRGKPKNAKHKLFHALEAVMEKTGNGGIYILAIRDTIMVSVDGLKPLTDAILKAKQESGG
jgi:hypothetical protein